MSINHVGFLCAGFCLISASLFAAPMEIGKSASQLCRSEFVDHAAPALIQANNRAVEVLSKEMNERRIPGLQAAVVVGGRVVLLASCGMADVEFGQPVTTETLFQLASATKPFTGVAIMQLVEEGKVRLDAPLSTYLTDLPGAWREVTVRQALTHTSGLPDIINPETGRVIDSAGVSASWAKVQTLPMTFAPGTNYAYNQTNYFLLGRVIDKLTGKPFGEFIRARQWNVVGMPNVTFSDTYDVVPKKAREYSYSSMVDGQERSSDTLKSIVTEFPEPLRTGAGLTASAKEIANWIVALQEGRLLSDNDRDVMWRAGTMPDGKPAVWALGWPTVSEGGVRAVTGNGGGRSVFYVYPDSDLAVVILTNLAGARPDLFARRVAGYYRSNTKP